MVFFCGNGVSNEKERETRVEDRSRNLERVSKQLRSRGRLYYRHRGRHKARESTFAFDRGDRESNAEVHIVLSSLSVLFPPLFLRMALKLDRYCFEHLFRSGALD